MKIQGDTEVSINGLQRVSFKLTEDWIWRNRIFERCFIKALQYITKNITEYLTFHVVVSGTSDISTVWSCDVGSETSFTVVSNVKFNWLSNCKCIRKPNKIYYYFKWMKCAPNKDLKPSFLMVDWWTKISAPPSSGTIKPYPLTTLKVLTTPVLLKAMDPMRLICFDATKVLANIFLIIFLWLNWMVELSLSTRVHGRDRFGKMNLN